MSSNRQRISSVDWHLTSQSYYSILLIRTLTSDDIEKWSLKVDTHNKSVTNWQIISKHLQFVFMLLLVTCHLSSSSLSLSSSASIVLLTRTYVECLSNTLKYQLSIDLVYLSNVVVSYSNLEIETIIRHCQSSTSFLFDLIEY